MNLDVISELMSELNQLTSRDQIRDRLRMIVETPPRVANVTRSSFVKNAARPYTNGQTNPLGARDYEPYFSEFKRLWDRVP